MTTEPRSPRRFAFAVFLLFFAIFLTSCAGTDNYDVLLPAGDSSADEDADPTDEAENTENSEDDGELVEEEYPAGPYGTDIGDTMADFTLNDCEGVSHSLKDVFGSAKAVFVNHSAGWCTICRSEAPTLNEWYETYKDQGLVILQLLNENDSLGPATAEFCQSWKKRYDIEFPVLVDADNILGPYHPGWPSYPMPLNLVLDRRMKITFVLEGGIDKTIETAIQAALASE